MIDQTHTVKSGSIRRCCRVLGFRRQTYYRRKQGFRSEHRDDEIVDLLHQITKRFVAWGFWMIFYFLRNQGHALYVSLSNQVLHLWLTKKLYNRSHKEALYLQSKNQ